MRADLSLSQARRIALAAQGFTDPPPAGAPTRAHLKRVIGRTKLIQLDSVNVLARAHYLPLFSRIGAYDEALLDRAAWHSTTASPRLLTEYWAHEAALIPVDDWPLFAWRMAEFADGRYRHTRAVLDRNRALAADVRDVVADSGACAAKDIEAALGITRPARGTDGWWDLGDVKHICEALFASGTFAATRRGNFLRYYDLADRVVGTEPTARRYSEADAKRELVARAASAHGVATVSDLADYYRMTGADVRAALPDLLDAGEVRKVQVETWAEPAYLHRDATIPRRLTRTALLSPFDPLVFFRRRTEALFNFYYRIEIYVPAHKRVHGYYVLPYLMGEQVVARVDLKADRKAGVLEVLAAHIEPEADPSLVAPSLAADLAKLAEWRGLSDIRIHNRGELATHLA